MEKHLILTKEQVERLGIDLANLELIVESQTTDGMVFEKDRQREIILNMSQRGAPVAVITDTLPYDETMLGRMVDVYSLYKYQE